MLYCGWKNHPMLLIIVISSFSTSFLMSRFYLLHSGCYSDGAIRMRETTLLIRQLIEKDFKQRLTAAQTLDIVFNRLSRL